MPFDCKRRDLAILAALVVTIFVYANLTSLHSVRKPWSNAVVEYSRDSDEPSLIEQHGAPRPEVADEAWEKGPANATLGFGTIIVVATRTSKRKAGIIEAANITEMELTIPDQPVWTEEDIKSVYDKNFSIITKGSALAWLGHMNALRAFLATNHTTALIMEDDVDWDIHVRHHQIPLVASQMRALLAENPTFPTDAYAGLRVRNREYSYWGDLTQWEVLWLGHCGDFFELKHWDDLPKNIFHDYTVPDFETLHPDTMKWLVSAGIGQHMRVIHRSKEPGCSFAYAVNRRSAERMLAEISHEETNHGTWAFDVRLREVCRESGWKCWTSEPELFHHMDEHDSAITEVNGKPLFEYHENVGEGTPNIECSARGFQLEGLGHDEKVAKARQIASMLDVCTLSDLEKAERQMELAQGEE